MWASHRSVRWGNLVVVALGLFLTGCGGATNEASHAPKHSVHACDLLTAQDAQQLLAPGSIFRGLSLPAIHECVYLVDPGWTKDHPGAVMASNVTLYVNFRNTEKGRSPVHIDGRTTYWSMLADDQGVMSLIVRPNSFVVSITGQHLSSMATKRLAERTTRMVLSRLDA